MRGKYTEPGILCACGSLASSLAQSVLLYFVALVPIAISPFPILGNWGGDWLFLFKSGRELVEGVPMTAGTLQRPPLFGAAAVPLWIVADGLVPFQLFAAVMSGGVLMLVCTHLRSCDHKLPHRV